MKYHEIEMAGKFWAQIVSSNPAWVAADEGRFIYNSTDKTLYYAGDAAWLEVAAGAVGGNRFLCTLWLRSYRRAGNRDRR